MFDTGPLRDQIDNALRDIDPYEAHEAYEQIGEHCIDLANAIAEDMGDSNG